MASYKIISFNGKAIKADGYTLVADDRDPFDRSQHFVEEPKADKSMWRSKTHGGVFDVSNSATAPNTKVILFKEKTDAIVNQQWTTGSDNFIQGKQSELFLGFHEGVLVITGKAAAHPWTFEDAPKDATIEIFNQNSAEVTVSYTRANGQKVIVQKIPAKTTASITTVEGNKLTFEAASDVSLFPSGVTATDGLKTTIWDTKPLGQWDPTFLFRYKDIAFTNSNTRAAANVNLNGGSSWHSFCGSVPLPYKKGEVYDFFIDKGDKTTIGVAEKTFDGNAQNWGNCVLNSDAPAEVRVTINLSVTPHTVTITDRNTNKVHEWKNNSFNVNDPAQFPLRVLVSLGSSGQSRIARI